MGTIAKYVIEANVDPSGVKRGIGEVITTMRKMQTVAKERMKLELQFPDLAKAESAQRAISGIQKNFAATMADAMDQLGRTQIDTKKFNAIGLQARKDFNKGLASKIDNLNAAGLLTPEIYNALVAQYKKVGDASGKAFGKAAQRGVAAHPLLGNLTTTGQRAANTLLNGLNTTYKARTNELKEQLVQGVINVQQFRRKGIEAASEFDQGLNAGLQKLRGKGQATKDITEALVSSFKLSGLKAANSFALSLDKQLGENVTRIGQTLTRAVTLPVVAGGAAALKLGADFENSMLRVQAIVKPTASQLQVLTEQARRLGAVSQFSAKDAAQAQAALAQQSFKTGQILSAMPVITDLAASSFLDMTEAAKISTGILRGYGLVVTDLRPKIDQMVALTTMAATNIQDLGTAFSFVGPDARAAGQSFETMAAAVGVLARAGVPASRVGTALRGILNRLTSPTKEAGKALEALGIKTRDAKFQMRSLIDIVGQFERAKKTFRPDVFQDLLGNIFEDRAGSGMKVLLLEGMEGLQKFRDELDKVGGTTKNLAEIQMSGLTGAMRELKSAAEELLLAIADSGLMKAFTNIVRGVAAVILRISQVHPAFIKFAVVIGTTVAVFGPLIAAIGRTMVLLSIARSAALLAGTSFATIGTVLAVGAPVLAGLGILVYLLLQVAENAGKAQRKIQEFSGTLATKNAVQLEAMKKDIMTSIAFNENLLAVMSKEARTKSNNPFAQSNQTMKNVRELLTQQKGMLEAVDKTIKQLGEAGEPLAGISDEVTKLLEGAAGAAGNLGRTLEGAASPVEALQDRVSLLSEIFSSVSGNFDKAPGLVNAVSAAVVTLNGLLAKTPDLITGTGRDLLRIQQQLNAITKDAEFLFPADAAARLRHALEDMGPLQIPITPLIAAPVMPQAQSQLRDALQAQFDEFKRIGDKAVSDKLDIAINKQSKNTQGAKFATDAYAKSLKRAQAYESIMAATIAASNAPLERKAEMWAKVQEEIAKYNKEGKNSVSITQRISNTLDSISDGARGIISIADALGQMSEGAREAMEAVADLADSMGSFITAVATGNIAGAISSGIGVVGSIVKLLGAGSQADAEAKKIVKENSTRLDELRRSVDGWAVTVKNMQTVKPIIDSVVASANAAVKAFGDRLGKVDLRHVQFKSVEGLDAQLKLAGSSFKELVAIADELNINILNEKGRLSAAGLDALSKAMELQRRKLTQFGESLDAQRKKLDLRRNVFNLDDSPVADLQDNLKLLEKFAPGIAKMFAGMDASTAMGRKMLEEGIQTLFNLIDLKLIDPSLFGSLEIEGVSDIIRAMADAFDKLREKADNVSESLTNLPPGFKIERARWRALLTSAEQTAMLNQKPTVAAVIPVSTTSTGTSAVVPSVGPSTVVLNIGDVYVTNPVKDGAQVYEEVRTEAKQRLAAKYGVGAVKNLTQVMP